MSCTEHGILLHNMSAPPKSVVKYSGLAELGTPSGPGGSSVCGVRFKEAGIFGTPVRFVLPPGFEGKSPGEILRRLGIDGESDPERRLAAMIDARADELPLPDGCAVIPVADAHRLLWPDALSALAVLAKCSDSVWLRAKTPALSAALMRRRATLLVPPIFASRLPGESA